VATVRFGEKEQTSYSRVNGMDAVTVNLINDSQANLIDLSGKTKTIIEKMNEKLAPQDIEIAIMSNSAESMEKKHRPDYLSWP
jgi:multidrug efflux pump subunit AcrB